MDLKQLQNLEKCRIGSSDHLSLLHVGMTVNILENCCVALPSHLWIGPGTRDLSKHPQSLNMRHRVWKESLLWHLRPCVRLALSCWHSWSFTGEEGVAMASSQGAWRYRQITSSLWLCEKRHSLCCWDPENIHVFTLFCEAVEGSHIKKKMKNPLIDGKSLGIYVNQYSPAVW